ncbi:hypothetical protein YC2023_075935 [Brassica napus]
MEMLVDYVSERHGARLKENRAMFVDPWFVDHLLGKARSFKAVTYKGRVFSDPKLAGSLTQEGKKLGVDVDKVYGPMIWGKNHWVGLAINIHTWSVQVFDLDHSLRSLEEVMVIMSPIAKMLPYLVRKVCPAEFLLGHGLEPFAVERLEFVYQNRRSGDCGPVAVKFLELSATAVEQPCVGDLTDNAVDILRKQNAMDVYRDWIVPLYMGATQLTRRMNYICVGAINESRDEGMMKCVKCITLEQLYMCTLIRRVVHDRARKHVQDKQKCTYGQKLVSNGCWLYIWRLVVRE